MYAWKNAGDRLVRLGGQATLSQGVELCRVDECLLISRPAH
jgi:hypothetical protein